MTVYAALHGTHPYRGDRDPPPLPGRREGGRMPRRPALSLVPPLSLLVDMVQGTQDLVLEARFWAVHLARRRIPALPRPADRAAWDALEVGGVPPSERKRAERFVALWWKAHACRPRHEPLTPEVLARWVEETQRDLRDPRSLMHDPRVLDHTPAKNARPAAVPPGTRRPAFRGTPPVRTKEHRTRTGSFL